MAGQDSQPELRGKPGDSEFQQALELLSGSAGMEADPPQGMALLRRVAERGLPDARRLLARLLAGDPKHVGESIALLRELTDAGDAEAMHLLGLLHFRGQGLDRDFVRARELQQRAADGGALDAAFELSLLLRQGIGGPPDLQRAEHYEAQAAEEGHPRACLNQGSHAASASPPRYEQAGAWYERAAHGGSAEAAARLCRMLLAGVFGRPDGAAAWDWYVLASDLGYRWESLFPELSNGAEGSMEPGEGG